MLNGGRRRSHRSEITLGGNAARKALSTASTSMTSWLIAPPTGLKWPVAANTMPTTLSTMPPTALCSAIDAHPAADVHELVHFLQRTVHDHDARRLRSHVAVLPIAMPTVAAIMAGASLIPSPT